MVRALSPDSARIANYLLDLNERVGANNSAQDIADTVNWRRTPQGQGALAELGAMAPPWRRNYLPYNPDPYDADDVRQHRQNRASGSSMPSAPQAPAPLPSSLRDVSPDSTHLLASQPDAFFASRNNTQQNVADQLNQARWAAGKSGPGYTVAEIKPVVASILRSRHEPSGGSVSMASSLQAATNLPNEALLGIVRQRIYPQDLDPSGPPLSSGHSIDSRATGSTHASRFSAASGQYPPPSIASSSTGPVRTRIGDQQRPAPYPPSLSRSSGTGMVGAGPGPSWRQKVLDPETGETISKNALAMRQKVLDPETGETISKSALAKRQKVLDPETGETISKNALAKRQKVLDPETGETISKNALAMRQKVLDPETGETISKNALAKRQKVLDPETGETISKSALASVRRCSTRRRAKPFPKARW